MKFGLGPVIFLIFMTLKLCKVITWSWLWVSSPLWIPISLWIIFFGGATLIEIIKRSRK